MDFQSAFPWGQVIADLALDFAGGLLRLLFAAVGVSRPCYMNGESGAIIPFFVSAKL